LYFDTSAFSTNSTSVIGHLLLFVTQMELVEFVNLEQGTVPDAQLPFDGRVTFT